MKQTSLAFGQRKSCTTVRECAGHTDLGEIRTCKYCFTISFLKKKCGSTPNVTTGDMLGQWGTKEQMLQRLLKNSEKKQRPQIVEVKQKGTFSDGAGKSLLLFFLFSSQDPKYTLQTIFSSVQTIWHDTLQIDILQPTIFFAPCRRSFWRHPADVFWRHPADNTPCRRFFIHPADNNLVCADDLAYKPYRRYKKGCTVICKMSVEINT